MVMEEEKEYYEKIIRNVTNNGHLYSCKFLDDPPKSHNEDEEQYSDLLNGQWYIQLGTQTLESFDFSLNIFNVFLEQQIAAKNMWKEMTMNSDGMA